MAGKLVKCKVCGEMIAKGAKTCPHCGAKQKKGILGIILIVFVALVVIAAVSGGNREPRKVGESGSGQAEAGQTPTAEQESRNTPAVFGVGERVELNGVIVTLVNIETSGGKDFFLPGEGNEFVLCEFEIENNASSDITVSSMLSFEAYIDDYAASMSLSATSASEKPQLDGTIAAGRKMNGVIGYETGKGWKTIEIRYTPDFWSGKEIVFAGTNG